MQSSRQFAAAGLLALLAVLSGCSHREAHADPGAAPAPPKVTVASPVLLPVTEYGEYTGRTTAVDTVEVRARASGHLQKVAFKEGDFVKKGDLLFVVDPRPYDAALARAQAELVRARADQGLGVRETARTEKLFATNVISERDRDNQSSSLEQANARVQVAQAAVTSAALDVEYAYVRAPISGRIGRIQVTLGNLVGPNLPTPLATIVSVDPLHVYVDVDEAHAGTLGAARAEVGFPGEEGRPHEAKVDFVDPRVDPNTGTLPVRIVVPNPDGKLTPGLFARVALPEGSEGNAVLVVDKAIGTDQDKRFVWTVGADGAVQYKRVKLGPLSHGLRVVREGVGPSDRVVIRGLQRIRPGSKVTPEQAPMEDADGGAP